MMAPEKFEGVQRLRLARLASAVLLALSLSRTASAAGAASLIEWDAPEGCLGALDVYARLSALLGREPETLGKLSQVRGSVVQTAKGYRLVLEAFEPARRSSRLFEAERCDDLVDAAAVAIALAIAPEEASRLAPSALAHADPGADARGERSSAEAATPSDAAASNESPRPAAPRLRGVASAGAVIEQGALPRLSPGFAVGGGVEWDTVSLGAYATLLASQTLRVAAGENVEFDLLFAGLRACHALRDRPPALSACASFEAGRMRALGLDLQQANEARDLWLAAGASVDARWPLSGALAIQLRAEPMFPLDRKEYTVNGSESVHAPARLSSRLYLGLTFSAD